MTPCHRIEIVIEKTLAKRTAEKLVALEVPGYTLIDQAGGLGDRGERRADEPTGSSTNVVFIIACETETEVDKIVEGIRPLLARSGGLCLISEARWVQH